MIAGHFGVAMAARARWGRLPLLAIMIAAIFPDIIDFVTAALRICGPDGLYSHSLPSIAIQSVVVGIAVTLWRRSPAAGAMVVGMIVLHLAADYITGLKVLWAGGPVVGLNLYAHPVYDFILEAVLTFGAWRLLRASPARDRWSSSPMLLVMLLATQVALDIASYAIGPVKPNGCPTSPLARSSLPPVSGR